MTQRHVTEKQSCIAPGCHVIIHSSILPFVQYSNYASFYVQITTECDVCMYVLLLDSINLFGPQKDFYYHYLMAEIPCVMVNDF